MAGLDPAIQGPKTPTSKQAAPEWPPVDADRRFPMTAAMA
jgi:hypothetical protein